MYNEEAFKSPQNSRDLSKWLPFTSLASEKGGTECYVARLTLAWWDLATERPAQTKTRSRIQIDSYDIVTNFAGQEETKFHRAK